MNTQTIRLDLNKRPAVQPVVYLRKGDKDGTTLAVEVYDNGTALALDGWTATFRMAKPGGGSYSNGGSVSGSTATFTVNEASACNSVGETDVAYVELTRYSGNQVTKRASTGNCRVVVLESA